ncbi:MAG: hypothetical protein WC773_01870 [Patescibacteria group bacterium]
MKKIKSKFTCNSKSVRKIERSVLKLAGHPSVRNAGLDFYITERQILLLIILSTLIILSVSFGILTPSRAAAPEFSGTNDIVTR